MARSRNSSRHVSTADAFAALRAQIDGRLEECARLIEAGVMIVDPMTTYIEPGAEVGAETIVYPNTTVSGETSIGRGCRIGPNAIVVDSRLGNVVTVFASVVEGATVEDGVDIGPFSHLRSGAHLERDVHVGNFVEIKAARLGAETKVGHFSYIGDAQVGEGVNVGAGTVTCNYDGKRKHKTIIEDGAFIGSDTMLVAPVRVGRRASTGAGAVVISDVPDCAQVAGVPARATTKPRSRRQVRSKIG